MPHTTKAAAHVRVLRRRVRVHEIPRLNLEAQLPMYWVPVLKSLYKFILSITQGPTIWLPGLLGLLLLKRDVGFRVSD